MNQHSIDGWDVTNEEVIHAELVLATCECLKRTSDTFRFGKTKDLPLVLHFNTGRGPEHTFQLSNKSQAFQAVVRCSNEIRYKGDEQDVTRLPGDTFVAVLTFVYVESTTSQSHGIGVQVQAFAFPSSKVDDAGHDDAAFLQVLLAGTQSGPTTTQSACLDIMRKNLDEWLASKGIFDPLPIADEEELFWAWVCEFYNEYSDEWLARNKTSLGQQFRPIFGEKMFALKESAVAPAAAQTACFDIVRKDLDEWLAREGIVEPPSCGTDEECLWWLWLRQFHRDWSDEIFITKKPALDRQYRPIFIEKISELRGKHTAPVSTQNDCRDIMRQDLDQWLAAQGNNLEPILPAAAESALFWAWVREFHKEYSDAWLARNKIRLTDQFRPIFLERISAQTA